MRLILIIGFLYVLYRFFIVPALALNKTYKNQHYGSIHKDDKEGEYVDYEEVEK